MRLANEGGITFDERDNAFGQKATYGITRI